MDLERNKRIVREFAEAINARDWGLRDEFAIFPDGLETIDDILAEGDKVAVRHGFRGTQHGRMGPYPPSGKLMTADYMAIYRVAGGLIVEAWAEWDNLSGLVQLGHYTPPGA